MNPIDQLVQIILREAPGAHVPDPTATKTDAYHEAQFTIRDGSGEQKIVYNIPRGINLAGRQAISRIERAYQAATSEIVYVKLLNGR